MIKKIIIIVTSEDLKMEVTSERELEERKYIFLLITLIYPTLSFSLRI